MPSIDSQWPQGKELTDLPASVRTRFESPEAVDLARTAHLRVRSPSWSCTFPTAERARKRGSGSREACVVR